MSTPALAVARYRFRATLPRRWGEYLSVVLLVGLVGGVAMAAVAGARRTQSSFPAYLAATRASDLQVQLYTVSSNVGFGGGDMSVALAHLHDVVHVGSAPTLLVAQLGPDGKALPSGAINNEVSMLGSTGGMYATVDRVAVSQGRLADPRRVDEIVATADAARISGWHVGETISLGAFDAQQALSSPAFNPLTTPPAQRLSVTLVGLVVVPSEVVHDDVDRFPTFVLATPALTRRLGASAAFPTYGLRLAHGSRDVATVEREIIGLLPRGSVYSFHVTSVTVGQVERASKPEAIALGAFGGIAALACLIIAGLAISRALWANREDLDVLQALGAGPVARTADAALGLLVSVVAGSLVAVGVAVALSPVAPIGPARQLDRAPGIALDWTVLGTGLAVLVMGLGALTVALAVRRTGRAFGRRAEYLARNGVVVTAVARTGLPPAAVAGLRFAFERGRGRTAVPVRSALVGAALAVTVVVATVTFGASLGSLDSHPDLYGWNWDYAITAPGGNNVPPVAGRLLDQDRRVAGWAGYSFANAQFDGQTVPILLSRPGAGVQPPILTGHGLEGVDEAVLGAATLAQLHKKVGQTVVVSYGSPEDAPVYVPPTRLRIVGTATLPTIGNGGTLHPSMGTGALIATGIEPPAFQAALTQPDPNLNGPSIEVVRLRPGTPAGTGRALVQRVADAATKVTETDPATGGGSTFVVQSVQRPAEIANYQSTGASPGVLAAGLAAGAVVALGLTLAASVRRRRRDLALLKTLGFTQRQVAAAVAWQASVAAVVGVVVGVPVGIALGRWLWVLFARQIFAVPQPTVPVLEVVLVALGALVLANLVAAVPGRMAARTPTALVLRSE
jgi:hypothetical protein